MATNNIGIIITDDPDRLKTIHDIYLHAMLHFNGDMEKAFDNSQGILYLDNGTYHRIQYILSDQMIWKFEWSDLLRKRGQWICMGDQKNYDWSNQNVLMFTGPYMMRIWIPGTVLTEYNVVSRVIDKQYTVKSNCCDKYRGLFRFCQKCGKAL